MGAVLLTEAPAVDDATRREFIVGGLSLAVLLAACGDDGSADGEPPASSTRSISTPLGDFEVPVQPERVVAFEGRRDLETALALGWTPIAVGENGLDAQGSAAPFLGFDVDGLDVVTPNDPNLEALATLQPDLIIGRLLNLEPVHAQLAEIAPLVPVDTDSPWRPDLERIGEWLGREDVIAAVLGDYDALRSEIAERHAAAIGEATVAIVQYFASDQLFQTSAVGGFFLQVNTLDELGGRYLPFLTDSADEFGDVTVSLEQIGELGAADAILLITSLDEDRAGLEAEPLWQQLPAVQAGRVIVTDARTNQGSVYAASECLRLLDRLYATLA